MTVATISVLSWLIRERDFFGQSRDLILNATSNIVDPIGLVSHLAKGILPRKAEPSLGRWTHLKSC